MYQQITMIGNLGETPELRKTPAGVSVTSFSLAVNKTWTNQDGSKGSKTTWFRITAWRGLAEIVCKYMEKGRQVHVVGEMEEARPWTGQDGETRASLEVTASQIHFTGNGNGNGATRTETEAPAPTEATTIVVDEAMPW